MTKEMMEEKLYQRMQEENQQFLAELREQTADDIIAHAYEIACRDNFRSSIECCASDAIRRDKERKAQKKDAPER